MRELLRFHSRYWHSTVSHYAHFHDAQFHYAHLDIDISHNIISPDIPSKCKYSWQVLTINNNASLPLANIQL